MVLPPNWQNIKADQISVLAVDDEWQVLAILSAWLKECGYEAACASNTAEALRILESRSFDVVLCDVFMPEMSGLDLIQKIKDLNNDALIIMMSGYTDIAMAKQALELGAYDFLVKPFSLLAVPIAIERDLRLRQMQATRIIEQRNKVLIESIKALSAAVDAKEHSTEHSTVKHSERIAHLALMMADEVELSPADRSNLELAAYMHDVGKIGISEAILRKPDRLSEAEWEEIKTHPDTASHILSNIEQLEDLAQIIRHHHEWVEGSGYPDGLSGEQIPLLSRILAVADAFDAMTSDRPYRRAMTEREAIRQLKKASGTQFDSTIVEIFLNRLKQQQKAA